MSEPNSGSVPVAPTTIDLSTLDPILRQLFEGISATFEARLAALSNEITQARNDANAAERLGDELKAQIAPSARNGIKIAPPADFDGSRDAAESFLRSCHLYFQGPDGRISSEADRISFALSHMKSGTAGAWANRVVDVRQRDPDAFKTWAYFEHNFKAQFGDTTPHATARTAMHTLRQKGRPADVYVSEFQTLSWKTGYGDVAHVEKFSAGLDSWLRDKIWDSRDLPEDLEDWYRMTLKFQCQKNEADAQRAVLQVARPSTTPFSAPVVHKQPGPLYAHHPVSTTPTSHRMTPQRSSEPTPMEIDRSGARPFRGACYECGGPHRAVDCDIRNAKKKQIRAMFGARADAMIRALETEDARGEGTPEPEFKAEYGPDFRSDQV